MDRAPNNPVSSNREFNRLRRRLITLTGLLILAQAGVSPESQGGVEYQTVPLGAETNVIARDESFPESRWGSAPMRARNVESASEELLVGARSGRSPASARAEYDMASNPSIDTQAIDRDIPSRSSSREPASDLGDPLTAAPKRAGVQEVAVIAGDLGFFPKKIFVNRDMPVRLFVTGASRKNLCVLIDAFQVRRQVRTQRVEEITFTPGTAGTYRIHCPINGIEGTLVVRELSGTTSLASVPSMASELH